jgi:aminoglycoside/choline kinase family phosphotransferase
LTDELADMVRDLASEPRVLCHRDYHSRNLMVTPRGLVMIDTQDARLGPDTYDLASLLRDSYVDLPDSLQDRLIERFRISLERRESRPAFDARFGLMAMQRNLKALGTFGYQATSRGNPVYAQYVPRTLRYVRSGLSRHERFGRLADVLGGLVPELKIG